jgi:hypothetical protein
MLPPVIEIAEAKDGWNVRWKTVIEATFPDAAAAVRFAQGLSTRERQPPRVRVYFKGAGTAVADPG